MNIDLKALGNAIATQDNRATMHPLFVVFQKREIVTDEDYDYDFIGWYDDEGDCADEETEAKLDAMRHDISSDYFAVDEITIEGDCENITWRRIAIKEVDVFVTACFTEQGCKDYLSRNGHNLRKPFIYVTSLYRNTEMIGLREFLLTQLEADTAP